MSNPDGVSVCIGTYASEGVARADYDMLHGPPPTDTFT